MCKVSIPVDLPAEEERSEEHKGNDSLYNHFFSLLLYLMHIMTSNNEWDYTPNVEEELD